MIRLMIDVNLGIGIEDYLKSQGYDVVTVRSINPSMDDEEICRLAKNESRIILTLDKDFGDLVYKNRLKHSGILILRLDDWSLKNKIDILQWILHQHGENLQDSFSIYQKGNLRIRKI